MKLNTDSHPNGSEAPSSALQICLKTAQDNLEQLERTKDALLAEFRPVLNEREHLLRLALNEAEALAWETGYPQLTFPGLAAEKIQSVATWHAQQQALQRRQMPLRLAA